MEDRGVYDGFRVFEVVAEDILTLVIGERNNESGAGIMGGVFGKIVKGLEDGCVDRCRVNTHPAPQSSLLVGFKVKTSHDPKVVAAAPKGKVEVWVGFSVHVFDSAVGKNNLLAINNVLRAFTDLITS